MLKSRVRRILDEEDGTPTWEVLGGNGNATNTTFEHAQELARDWAAPGAYLATVTVWAETPGHASRVMAERIGCDEDYGFDYMINWEAAWAVDGVEAAWGGLA